MDTQSLVSSACAEIVELTRNRNSVLIFTTSVEHGQHVAAEISRRAGTECGIVTGDTPVGQRAELLARFKGETVQSDLFGGTKPPLKYLGNVNVLTTGFDATNVDCVVLLRPTASVGLYVQMVGRGTRLHPGKEDCLILDYGGNVLRHRTHTGDFAISKPHDGVLRGVGVAIISGRSASQRLHEKPQQHLCCGIGQQWCR